MREILFVLKAPFLPFGSAWIKHGRVRCRQQVLDGTRPVAAFLELVRQLGCYLCLAQNMQRLGGSGQGLVQVSPSYGPNPAIQNLAVPHMHNYVTGRGTVPVIPKASRADNLMPLGKPLQ